MRVMETTFQQRSAGAQAFKSLYAKRTREMMARRMAEHRQRTVKELQGLDLEGYRCDAKASADGQLVFTRPKPAAKKAS